MNRRERMIERNRNRELYWIEIIAPSGNPHVFFEGWEHIDIGGGYKKLSPDRPTFTTEQAGREWLAGAR